MFAFLTDGESKELSTEEVEEIEKERFFLIKVKEKMSPIKGDFLLTKARSDMEARNIFNAMRPKGAIKDIKKWEILGVYDLTKEADWDILMKRENFDQDIIYYIRKTEIGTFYPDDYRKKVCDLMFHYNTTGIVHIYDSKEARKFSPKSSEVENLVEIDMGTTNTRGYVWTKESGDAMIECLLGSKLDLSFVLYEKTIGDSIQFSQRVYELAEGMKGIHLQFYFYGENQLYRMEFHGREMRVIKL